jgi:hypothetical protein
VACERRNGRTYYYHSRRVGGRVVRHYLGAGAVGARAEQARIAARQQKDREQQQALAQMAELDELAQMVGDVIEAAGQALEMAMAAAGYHRHHRGQWRRRRHEQDHG